MFLIGLTHTHKNCLVTDLGLERLLRKSIKWTSDASHTRPTIGLLAKRVGYILDGFLIVENRRIGGIFSGMESTKRDGILGGFGKVCKVQFEKMPLEDRNTIAQSIGRINRYGQELQSSIYDSGLFTTRDCLRLGLYAILEQNDTQHRSSDERRPRGFAKSFFRRISEGSWRISTLPAQASRLRYKDTLQLSRLQDFPAKFVISIFQSTC